MYGSIFNRVILFLLLVVIAGCCNEGEAKGSKDIGVGNIYVDIVAVANGDAETVIALHMKENDASGNTIVLSSAHDLFASPLKNVSKYQGGGMFSQLRQDRENARELVRLGIDELVDVAGYQFGYLWYVTTFPSVISNQPFYITLETGGANRAENSSVSLPEVVKLISPLSSDMFSRAIDDIVISWEPSSSQYPVKVTADASCSNVAHHWENSFVDDPGSATVPAGEFNSLSGFCAIHIVVERKRSGEVSSGFAGGVATGSRRAEVTVLTNP